MQLGTPDRLPSWDKTLTIYQGIYFVPFFINSVGDISRRRGLFTVAWLNAILISVCAIHAPWVVPPSPRIWPRMRERGGRQKVTLNGACEPQKDWNRIKWEYPPPPSSSSTTLTLPLTNHMTWPQKRIAVGVAMAMRPKGGNGIYEHVSKLNTTQEQRTASSRAPTPSAAPSPAAWVVINAVATVVGNRIF